MKLKTLSLSIFLAVFSFLTLGFTMPAHAADTDICSNTSVPEEIRSASGCDGGGGQLETVIINIINVVLSVVGIIAVIAIIIGGVQYMTSTGDPGKVKKAKETIMYAVIGLIVVILAAVIVNFVIKATTAAALPLF